MSTKAGQAQVADCWSLIAGWSLPSGSTFPHSQSRRILFGGIVPVAKE
jgi:hypothetical protein